MRDRRINYLRHPLSARQALAIALECWGESRHLPILLITPTGQSEDAIKNIRVILSKERKKVKDADLYGFIVSSTFPWTENGVTGEAVVLEWRITMLQNMRNTGILKGLKELF